MSGQSSFLAIERFDRKISDGRVELIHQEDCAQALGLDWVNASSQFQNRNWPDDPDGPSAYTIADVVASVNGGGLLVDWLRQLTYRVLVPVGVSPGLRDGLEWNLTRLTAGNEISQCRR